MHFTANNSQAETKKQHETVTTGELKNKGRAELNITKPKQKPENQGTGNRMSSTKHTSM